VKSINEVIVSSGLEVKEVEVKKIVDSVKKGNVSKSKGMVLLYELGFDRGEIRDILNSGGVKVSYNFINNVLVDKYGNVRKSRNNNSGESKSSLIKRLYSEGLKEREIGEEFVKRGIYVNSNMIYKIVKGEKKKVIE